MDESNRKADEKGTEYKVGPGCPPLETRYVKGQPGGPGHPKGEHNLRTKLAMLLEAQAPDKIRDAVVKGMGLPGDAENKVTILEAMIARLILRVLDKGDSAAFEKLMDRYANKPKQSIELEQTNAQPQKLIIGGQEITVNV